jgi:hypothetical protein
MLPLAFAVLSAVAALLIVGIIALLVDLRRR